MYFFLFRENASLQVDDLQIYRQYMDINEYVVYCAQIFTVLCTKTVHIDLDIDIEEVCKLRYVLH